MTLRAVHLTTVHPRTDTRIRLKEVATLAGVWPGEVALFVQDGKGDETDARDGFIIHDTGAPQRTRLRRMTVGAWRMYRAVRRARPRVAHFHDPELLPWAVLLRLSGIRIVYDVHEDVPLQILGKFWIPKPLRRPVAGAVWLAEAIAARAFSRIAAASPAIACRFPPRKTVLVQNFPILTELHAASPVPFAQRPPHLAYIGGVTAERGAEEMTDSLPLIPERLNARLQLAGIFTPPALEARLRGRPGWHRIDVLGWQSRPQVADLLGRVRVGVVTFLARPNHIAAQPNKLFEYMSAGLPVIASDFPLWRRIVGDAGCGLLVDPADPDAIAAAAARLLDDPAEAEAMGRRGREAVERRYNWNNEAARLIEMYKELAS